MEVNKMAMDVVKTQHNGRHVVQGIYEDDYDYSDKVLNYLFGHQDDDEPRAGWQTFSGSNEVKEFYKGIPSSVEEARERVHRAAAAYGPESFPKPLADAFDSGIRYEERNGGLYGALSSKRAKENYKRARIMANTFEAIEKNENFREVYNTPEKRHNFYVNRAFANDVVLLGAEINRVSEVRLGLPRGDGRGVASEDQLNEVEYSKAGMEFSQRLHEMRTGKGGNKPIVFKFPNGYKEENLTEETGPYALYNMTFGKILDDKSPESMAAEEAGIDKYDLLVVDGKSMNEQFPQLRSKDENERLQAIDSMQRYLADAVRKEKTVRMGIVSVDEKGKASVNVQEFRSDVSGLRPPDYKKHSALRRAFSFGPFKIKSRCEIDAKQQRAEDAQKSEADRNAETARIERLKNAPAEVALDAAIAAEQEFQKEFSEINLRIRNKAFDKDGSFVAQIRTDKPDLFDENGNPKDGKLMEMVCADELGRLAEKVGLDIPKGFARGDAINALVAMYMLSQGKTVDQIMEATPEEIQRVTLEAYTELKTAAEGDQEAKDALKLKFAKGALDASKQLHKEEFPITDLNDAKQVRDFSKKAALIDASSMGLTEWFVNDRETMKKALDEEAKQKAEADGKSADEIAAATFAGDANAAKREHQRRVDMYMVPCQVVRSLDEYNRVIAGRPNLTDEILTDAINGGKWPIETENIKDPLTIAQNPAINRVALHNCNTNNGIIAPTFGQMTLDVENFHQKHIRATGTVLDRIGDLRSSVPAIREARKVCSEHPLPCKPKERQTVDQMQREEAATKGQSANFHMLPNDRSFQVVPGRPATATPTPNRTAANPQRTNATGSPAVVTAGAGGRKL
jgi:hypothetical protein